MSTQSPSRDDNESMHPVLTITLTTHFIMNHTKTNEVMKYDFSNDLFVKN